jgi:hypothetical protein
MTKYLIFNNNLSTGKRNSPGTPEAVACDIARSVDMDEKVAYDYIAYSADTPDATLEVLKALPVYSINLTKRKIDLWHNDALPILNKILAVTEAVENARDSITSAIDDLQFDSRNSEIFHEMNIAGEIDIDRAFKHIDNQSDYIFAAMVKSVFGLEYLSHAQGVTT